MIAWLKNHNLFGFIHSKTMVNFRKGTWKLLKADALMVVQLLPTLKHVINVNSQKMSLDYERNVGLPKCTGFMWEWRSV